MVRVSAITVNGTGPATEWMTAETFESDLDGTNRQTHIMSRLCSHYDGYM